MKALLTLILVCWAATSGAQVVEAPFSERFNGTFDHPELVAVAEDLNFGFFPGTQGVLVFGENGALEYRVNPEAFAAYWTVEFTIVDDIETLPSFRIDIVGRWDGGVGDVGAGYFTSTPSSTELSWVFLNPPIPFDISMGARTHLGLHFRIESHAPFPFSGTPLFLAYAGGAEGRITEVDGAFCGIEAIRIMGNGIRLDNLEVRGGAVSVDHGSWGAVKALYEAQ